MPDGSGGAALPRPVRPLFMVGVITPTQDVHEAAPLPATLPAAERDAKLLARALTCRTRLGAWLAGLPRWAREERADLVRCGVDLTGCHVAVLTVAPPRADVVHGRAAVCSFRPGIVRAA
jgi:hypothetical protein